MFVSFFDDRIEVPKDIPDVSDVKGRTRFENIFRSWGPLASRNLGNKNVPVTVIEMLISVRAHNPRPRAL